MKNTGVLSEVSNNVDKVSPAGRIPLRKTADQNQTIQPRVSVTPSAGLTDENVEIAVTGLPAHTHVTLRARIKGDSGDIFESFAFYVSSNTGDVRITSDASVGGSYTGIEPMGLLWAMKPANGQRKGIRLSKRDVTKPYSVALDVFQGHQVDFSVSLKIASGTFQRFYMAKGVRRIPVRAGRVRGTLFVPPGAGPFPGVIDIFGTAGGLIEFKAALLASHGFAAFALAYFGYEDLPKVITEISLEYFEEATEWLIQHQKVIPHGIGVMGVSKGSELALILASYRPELFKAVVLISPAHAIVGIPLLIRDNPSAFVKFEPEFMKLSEDGAIQLRDTYPDNITNHDVTVTHPAMIPVERIQCPLMLMCGNDDKNWHSTEMGNMIVQRMKRHGKGSQCTQVCYDATGHLIEPPYSPHCKFSYHKAVRAIVAWGGEAKQHSYAQEDSWDIIIRFLNKNLSMTSVQSHL